MAILALLLPACGGGGGGGGSSSSAGASGVGGGGGGGVTSLDPKKHFFLTEAAFARPVFTVDGSLDPVTPVVNPASLFETDPLTGVPLPGFPKVLVPGTPLGALATLSFDQILDPLTPQMPLIQRNAALVLTFSHAPDLATLSLDDSDPDMPGVITALSNIQVATKGGDLVGARIEADPTNDKRLVLIPVATGSSSWPASPLVFDKQGNAVEDPSGFLRITLGTGLPGFVAVDEKPFLDRSDKLGTSPKAIPFNPGNGLLDPVVLQTGAGVVGFNGFLPDLTAPRIVRPVLLEGTVAGVLGGELRDTSLPSSPNVAANGGDGEWANSLLTITSGGGVETQYVVERNTLEGGGGISVFYLEAGSVFEPVVGPGDTYEIVRSEFFEPVPPPLPSNPTELARVTVDPDNHPRDPDDPQDLLNSDLRYFARMFDEAGVERTDVWDPATGTFLPVPPKTSVQFEFSEAMDSGSTRPYETFYVSDTSLPVTDPAFRSMRIGVTEASVDGRTVLFSPFLEDQVEPLNSRFIGFGGTPSSLRLVLRTVPEASDVQSLIDSAVPSVLDALVDTTETGVLGITDLGGRSLGLPPALLDQSDPLNFLLVDGSPGRGAFAPAVDFKLEFETSATSDPDFGAVVHRFMGQASTSIFSYPDGQVHDEVTQGIEYYDYPPEDDDSDGSPDRRFIYGPTLLEVGLNVPGRLTGASAATIEHLIDNFNKPKRSGFASPNGEDFLISVGFGLSLPLNSGYGARFQHVYRAGDASPSFFDFRGAVLDLVGLAWSPFDNFVSNTTIDGMEILVGLSGANRGRGPNTNQTNGIPADDDSGLVAHFDCNKLEWVDNCVPDPDIQTIIGAGLTAAQPLQPPMTAVVKKGTPYVINSANLFKPANAANSNAGFNLYMDFPEFNAGIDPVFGREDVFSFPYDSWFPMLIEYDLEPQESPPSSLNFFRFSPGILSSALPRFRVWSQGQHPTAHCVPNWTLHVGPGPYNNNQKAQFRGGEGGPLVEPGCIEQPITPPEQNNGQPIIPVSDYILPPFDGTTRNQPPPDWSRGTINADDMDALQGCIEDFPTCNSDPYMNWYYANGMLMYPLPNFTAYPGPTGQPPTLWYGYGVPAAGVCGLLGPPCPNGTLGDCIIPGELGGSNQINPPVLSNEPNMTGAPARFGDNSRYYMMWKYRKRVSIIESPTIEAEVGGGGLRYMRPIVDPPLADVDPAASLLLELKAGTLLDFSVPQVDSGYVDVLAPSFQDDVTGAAEDRVFVKFRASFGVAEGQSQPPTIETIVIPYEKTSP
jgi:hypothetical protein